MLKPSLLFTLRQEEANNSFQFRTQSNPSAPMDWLSLSRDPPAMPSLLNYALITPARNEADYIELTIKSMIAQTHLPLKWVIVSDGSTDQTDELVGKYLDEYKWIELVRTPDRKTAPFCWQSACLRRRL